MPASEHLSRGVLAAIVYAILSVADMGLSSAAFIFGVREANPVLAWLVGHGLFIPAKLVLTGIAAALIVWLYPRAQARPLVWIALLTMAAVNLYHVWGLTTL